MTTTTSKTVAWLVCFVFAGAGCSLAISTDDLQPGTSGQDASTGDVGADSGTDTRVVDSATETKIDSQAEADVEIDTAIDDTAIDDTALGDSAPPPADSSSLDSGIDSGVDTRDDSTCAHVPCFDAIGLDSSKDSATDTRDTSSLCTGVVCAGGETCCPTTGGCYSSACVTCCPLSPG